MSVIRRPVTAVGRWLGSIRPERRSLRADLVAGLPGAISSVPDGMAAAVLVGVNPVQGLYAGFAGPIAGGLTSSTRRMVITTTSAASLAAGSALRSVPEAQRPEALLLLALMAGAALVAAGLAGLGRYTRFVSYWPNGSAAPEASKGPSARSRPPPSSANPPAPPTSTPKPGWSTNTTRRTRPKRSATPAQARQAAAEGPGSHRLAEDLGLPGRNPAPVIATRSPRPRRA